MLCIVAKNFGKGALGVVRRLMVLCARYTNIAIHTYQSYCT